VDALTKVVATDEARLGKGLKGGALGLIASTVVGVASTAPAYSLAATLFFVVAIIGKQSPIVTVLAFVPMLFVAIGYKEMNRADPDCGTTFTWATRAFGPRTGWWGGWGIVAADLLVMASLAQIAGQYVFLLFGAHGIGTDASSGWVLLVGIAWIVFMTFICYVGIEVSANFQKVLLTIEVTMLVLLSVVALTKVFGGHAPPGHLAFSWTWFNPFDVTSASAFTNGILLMLFIYWGWDTAVSVNEETKLSDRTPGRAAVLSTVLLLAIYALVILSVQSYAGLGKHGIGLANRAHGGDVLSVLGSSIFGTSGLGTALSKLLLLMVLSSAAASTQTTILPTARTMLAMGVYRSVPSPFARISHRFLTPTVSTVSFGVVSIGLYVAMNFISAGAVIIDSVTALGVMIAFYYGLTAFSCTWYYRRSLMGSARSLFMRGIFPALGGLMMYGALAFSLYHYWNPANSTTSWTLPIAPHWQVGGVFVIDILTLLVGLAGFAYCLRMQRPFFRGEVLNATTPTVVPADVGAPIGLFGIDTDEATEVVSALSGPHEGRGGSRPGRG
jgi:amino acid transporter